ncbi:MAG: DUF3368 domain-containing protein [Armatimonadetes bacterium]|nr:DUF3368 domain-containing protein [Armatimonadota bacterium]
MSIASDTGPLIALAKADLLFVLKSLFEDVLIPPAVLDELLAKRGPEREQLDAALHDFVNITPLPVIPWRIEEATQVLGVGERHAIALATNTGISLVLDDRLGRTIAHKLGLSVVGTVGTIVEAKRTGIIPVVRPLEEHIRDCGYYLSDELIQTAAKLAEE